MCYAYNKQEQVKGCAAPTGAPLSFDGAIWYTVLAATRESIPLPAVNRIMHPNFTPIHAIGP